MVIETKHFGKVEIDEENKLLFDEGIFGFSDLKNFVILLNQEEESAFCWLQSLEKPEIALPMIDPLNFFSTYDPVIAGNSVAKIGELKEEDLKLYTIVVVPEDITNMTTNLKAPILINIKTKKGIQVIVEDEIYELRHNLYDQIQALKQVGE